MSRLVQAGLDATKSLWADIERASAWVHRAALLLENTTGAETLLLRRDYRQLLSQVAQARQSASSFLRAAAVQFAKVSVSYWRGLFCTYSHPNLPRTNNAAEQGFGSFRYHERRASGRKVTSTSTVLRGSVRIVAATAQPRRPFSGSDLRPKSVSNWRQVRHELDQKRETRRQQRRFQRDPEAFVATIETNLIKQTLPT